MPSSRAETESPGPWQLPSNQDQHSRWGYVWVLGASVATIVVAVFAWNHYAGTPVVWDRAQSSDGLVIKVLYGSGACDDGAAADVDESLTTVTITVRSRNFPDASCTDNRVARIIEVSLNEPLGDRELVDGACVLGKFEGRRSCLGGGVRVLEEQ